MRGDVLRRLRKQNRAQKAQIETLVLDLMDLRVRVEELESELEAAKGGRK